MPFTHLKLDWLSVYFFCFHGVARVTDLKRFIDFTHTQSRKGMVPPKDGWMDLDNHDATTDEIRSLVSDLGVLGKADFKLLLRWRMTIRKQAGLEKKSKEKRRRGHSEASSDDDSDDEDDDEDEDMDDEDGDDDGDDEKDQLLDEMSELKNAMDASARREKKKKAKIKQKERLRVARGLATQGEAIVENEMDLFSLARIKTKGALDTVSKAPTPGIDAAHDSDEDPDEGLSDEDSDSEVDERRLDKEVDEMWAMYKARRTKKGDKFTEASKGRDKRTELGAGELDESGSESDDDDLSDPADDEFKSDDDELEWDDDGDDEDDVPKVKKSKAKHEANPLVVNDGSKPAGKNASAAAKMWFANDLFASDTKTKAVAKPMMDSDEDEEEDEPVVKAKIKKDKKKKSKDDEDNFDDLRAKAKEAKISKAQAKDAAKSKANAKRDDTYDDESDDETTRKKNRKKKSGGDDGFEVAPAERDASSGSESDSDGFGYNSEVDELSDDTRARILALGKKMINKKEREELIEDGYNRYAFDDDDVPDWFAEDERKFMKPVPQYTAAELAEAKASLAAVNTRPIKKVAEAKWRKKKRAEAKIAQARNRAASIIEQDDVPDVSKAKEIERVFARARRSTSGAIKKPRKVVVARKYHRGNAGGPSVDKRQLADARGQKNAEKRKGGKHGRGRSTTRGKGKPKR